MDKLISMVFVTSLFAAPVAATDTTPAAPAVEAAPAATNAPARREKIICKTVARIGSRLVKDKSCHTESEWADYEFQARQHTKKIQERIARN